MSMDIYLKKLYFDSDPIVDIFLKEDYLFNWDTIQGKDRGEFIKFLRNKYNVKWIKTAKIEVIDGGMTINVSTKMNALSLKLNDGKTKATIKIDDGRTDKIDMRMKNDKLNAYGEKNLGKSKETKIENAKELWSRWNGEPIRISPYLLGEFIAASSSERYHHYPFEVLKIINNEIIPKCEMVYAKLTPDPIIFDMPLLMKYGLLSMEFQGEAKIFNKPVGRRKAFFQITKDIFQGNWADYDVWKKDIEPGLSFDKPEITVSSTYFEIEFFRKASEFSQEFDIPLKDAIHLIYATQEKMDIIVASCDDFRNAAQKIEERFGIKVYSPEQILSKLPTS